MPNTLQLYRSRMRVMGSNETYSSPLMTCSVVRNDFSNRKISKRSR
jgi:hypothetical protein